MTSTLPFSPSVAASVAAWDIGAEVEEAIPTPFSPTSLFLRLNAATGTFLSTRSSSSSSTTADELFHSDEESCLERIGLRFDSTREGWEAGGRRSSN
jgi:hypothetical protein